MRIHPSRHGRDSLVIQTNKVIPLTPGNLIQALQHWQTADWTRQAPAAKSGFIHPRSVCTASTILHTVTGCVYMMGTCVPMHPPPTHPHMFSVQLQKFCWDFVRTGKGDKRIWEGRRRGGGRQADRMSSRTVIVVSFPPTPHPLPPARKCWGLKGIGGLGEEAGREIKWTVEQ